MDKKKIRAFPIIIGILAVCVVLAIIWSIKVSDINNNYDNVVEISNEERSELIGRIKYCNDMFIFSTGENAMYFCDDFSLYTIYPNELVYYPVKENIASNTDEMYKEARSCFSGKVISNSKLRQKMFNLGGKSKVELLRKDISSAVNSLRRSIQGLFTDNVKENTEYVFYPLFTTIDGKLAYLKEAPPMMNIRFDYSAGKVVSYSQNKASVRIESHSGIDYDTNTYIFNMVRNKSGEWKIDSIKLLGGGIRPYYEL